MFNLKEFIESYNIPIKTVYDIGACVGAWTKSMRTVLPEAEFYLFEANANCENSLQGERYYIEVLSSRKQEVTFYSNGGIDTGESYYLENTLHYSNPMCTSVETVTLDDSVLAKNIPTPDFVKIDTQGSELDIILGGQNSLKNTTFIQVEMPIINYNRGGASFDSLTKVLSSKGFYAVGILEHLYSDNYLVQADVLFMHKDKKELYVSETPYLILP